MRTMIMPFFKKIIFNQGQMILVLLFGRCSPHVARDSILTLSVISKGQSLWGHLSCSAVLGCIILNQALIFVVPLPHFLSNS